MIRSLAKSSLNGITSIRNRILNIIDKPVVVLIYHRVTDLPNDPQLLAVSPENFSAQMRYLRDNFPVLRFEADWGRITEPSVIVTFDDGYADNFLEALPILESVGIPATFFISTDVIGSTTEFWWDELERLILGTDIRPERCRLNGNRRNMVWETGDSVQRLTFYRELHPLLRRLTSAEREAWIEQLRSWAGCDLVGRSTHRALSIAELKAGATSEWVTVGAHGVTHTRLSNLAPAEQRYEIMQSKQRLEELCEKEITVFSYPFGCRRDYDRTTLGICRDAGFRRVAANFPGQVHRWSDPLQIPRQLVRNWPLDQFMEKLNGFFYV